VTVVSFYIFTLRYRTSIVGLMRLRHGHGRGYGQAERQLCCFSFSLYTERTDACRMCRMYVEHRDAQQYEANASI